jgi:CRP/FNR family transcriptional regulator, cyclic AMP receptor protein
MTGENHGKPARPIPSRRSARKPKRPPRLSGLPARLSRELFAGAEAVRLPAGHALFRAGDRCEGCYRVEDGLLKLTIVSTNSGTERILAFQGPGAIVGELSVIDGRPRSMSAVAVRDTELSFLSRAAFQAFAEKHPELCQSLLRLVTKRVRERDKMVAATSFLMLKGRIAQTLLELADHFGQEVGPGRIVIRKKIRQRDLAAMAGIARENVTRVLNDWERGRLVSRLSGYYCLENRALLEHQVRR